MWEHMTKIKFDQNGKAEKARCNYCHQEYCCVSTNGTSTLRKHILNCKKYPFNERNKGQQSLSFQSTGREGSTNKLLNWCFNQERSRIAFAKMIITDELPFRFIEREGFRHFMSVTQPEFKFVSRNTVVKDCFSIYMQERKKLKDVLTNSSQRVCLTTDCWTSLQNISYMCLTAHFIDKDWKLHKRIINFCVLPSHKGKDIGKMVEFCLINWGIDKLCTITVDNASSNDVAVEYLRSKISKNDGLLVDGKYFHMRCCAHILNLIVRDGINEVSESICRIRGIVKYIRSSPSRASQFRACVDQERISSKALCVLDVPTRWNYTYLMLESALKYQRAFERLEDQDSHFASDLREGPPMGSDWDNARALVKFLKCFFESTKRLSGSLYVTSNSYFREVFKIENTLVTWSKSSDINLSLMAIKMKEKFDKYWGNIDKVNMMLLIAVLLDPRYKLEYIEFCYAKVYEVGKVKGLIGRIMGALTTIFDHYQRLHSLGPSSSKNHSLGEINKPVSLSPQGSRSDDDGDNVIDDEIEVEYKLHRQVRSGLGSKSEIDRFLEDEIEDQTPSFDILVWWKANSSKYRILSQVAKDVLAIPVSTVASESAFSTGGRVLDQFRSSLTPKIVECLICTQDWLRASSQPIEVEEKLEDLQEIETSIVPEI